MRPSRNEKWPVQRSLKGLYEMSTQTIAPSQDSSVVHLSGLVVLPDEALIRLKRRWGIYTHGTLKQRCSELESHEYMIADLIPKRSLSIVVGDSGLGKSPLLYQAALCVAEGKPFLGKHVSCGRVLYVDFENGLRGVDEVVSRLSGYLGLPAVSENFLHFNYNDAPANWEPSDLREMVTDVKPDWVIIDPIAAFAPEIDTKNHCVTHVYQVLRSIIKDTSTTVSVVHHIRKLSTQPGAPRPDLEEDTRGWFQQARGPRQLINGADIRIGIDKCGRADTRAGLDGRSADVAFVLAGFGRLRGNIDPMYVGRVRGEDDRPMGYEQLRGASLLFNSDRQTAYETLSESFTFTQAKQTLNRGAQATSDFLSKCQSVGILRKEGRQYRKLKVTDCGSV